MLNNSVVRDIGVSNYSNATKEQSAMIFIPAYVYKITNTITGEFYYGYRYKNIKLNLLPKDDIWVNYFTSSHTIDAQVAEYGANAFTVEIVFEHEDSLVCWTYEQLKIRDNWGNPLLLNGKYHDPDSDVEVIRRVGILTDRARRNMSKAGKGRPKSESHKQNIAAANTGNVGSAQKRKKLSVANTDMVRAIDLQTNKNVKIPSAEFEALKGIKYKGITAGLVSAYDLTTNKYCSISREEFNTHKHTKYVGVNSKLIPLRRSVSISEADNASFVADTI